MVQVLSVDPGRATGWAYGEYSNTQPLTLCSAHITPDWPTSMEYWFTFDGQYQSPKLVVEKFTLRANNFVANLDGVKLEGLMEGTWQDLGFSELIWRTPAGKGKAGEKRGTSEFDKELKRLGWWQTGSMVGHKDGRDANDAIIHMLKYMIDIKHMPTLEAYFPDFLED